MSDIANKVNSSVEKAIKYALEQTARNSKSNSARSLASNYTAGKGLSGANWSSDGQAQNVSPLSALTAVMAML